MSGKAKFDIIAEDRTRAAWNSALGNAKSATDQIHHMLTFAIAGFSVERIVEFGKRSIEAGDHLEKFAIKAGFAGKEASTLAFAARLSDIDITSLSTAVKKMNVALSEARSGSKAQVDAFHALGLEAKDLAGLKTDERFVLIAQRISLLGNVEDKTRALTEIFGRAGADLAPMFEQGAAGIRKAREEAEKIGYAFDDETLHRMTEAEDNIKKMGAAWEALGITLSSKVAGPMSKVLDDMSSGAAWERAKKFMISPIAGLSSAMDEVVARDTAAAKHGGVGRPGGDAHDVPVVPGFPSDPAAAEAARKQQQKFLDDYHQSLREMNAEVDRDADAALKRDGERWIERQDQAAEWYDKYKEREKELEVYREEQAMHSINIIRDGFVNAIDDMVNTGKFSFRDLFKFIVAEFAKQKIGELFSTIASSFGKSGGSGGGFLSSLFGAIAGAYGGGRAGGGDVQAGKFYKINENTPHSEYWAPGMSGAVVKSAGMGGGITYAPQYNIDARGASMDLAKALPGILKQHGMETENRIVGRLRRDWYGLGQ